MRVKESKAGAVMPPAFFCDHMLKMKMLYQGDNLDFPPIYCCCLYVGSILEFSTSRA